MPMNDPTPESEEVLDEHTVGLLVTHLSSQGNNPARNIKQKSNERLALRNMRQGIRKFLYAKLSPPRSPVRGVAIASDNLLECLLRQPTGLNFRAFAQEPMNRTYRDWLASLVPTGRPSALRILPATSLTTGRSLEGISAWLETNGMFHLAYRTRDRLASGAFPIACSVHGLSAHYILQESLLPVLMSETYPADSFVCPTRSAAQALQNILASMEETLAQRYGARVAFHGRYDIIPLCVDTDRLCPGDKARAKKELKLSQTGAFVLYLGRLDMVKADLFPMFAALAEERARVERFDLSVGLAGTASGDYCKSLFAYLRAIGYPTNRVKVFLDISDEQRLRLLRAADIFTSPVDTINESFGLAPVEAMAVGVPQVLPDWDGYRETVEHGVTGRRVPTLWAPCDRSVLDSGFLLGWEYDHRVLGQSVAMDMKRWREDVFALIENRELRFQMGEASRRRAVATYSMDIVARQYRTLLCELSARHRATASPKANLKHVDRPQYYATFKHYASNTLSSQSTIEVSPHGAKASPEWLDEIFHDTLTAKVVDMRRIHFLLARVKEIGPCSLDDLVKGSSGVMPTDAVIRHVMWAIKYGLINWSEPRLP